MSGRRRSSRTRSAGEASRAPSPVATRDDVEALALEPGHERLGDRVLVLDDQDVHIPSVAAPLPLGIRT